MSIKVLAMTLLAQVPLPRDLDLPLPLPGDDLKVILVILFLAHILFVNFMIGGSLMTAAFEIIGLTSVRFDQLARRIAHTITVNKSLAVVLGVGPLLCISLVYTTHFYTANSLTGYAWISIVPLVILAFLLTYLHKYTWDRWTEGSKRLHVAVGVLAVLVFLCVPLVFLTNINLMLFPDRWHEVKGFFSSLRVGNVFPRLFHFLTASMAITGLFLAGWFGRKRFPIERVLPGFERLYLKRLFYRIAFYFTLAQFAFGPLLLFTLPADAVTGQLLAVIVAALAVILVFLILLGREIRSTTANVGGRFLWLVLTLSLAVLAMGTGRHLYREAAVAPHRAMIEEQSATFHSIELATQMRIEAGLGAGDALGGGPTGESVFTNCAACHALSRVLAAPSLVEISSIYRDDPSGIVKWAKNPGKKRPEFAPMPSFAHLGDEQLLLVAEYMLEQGKAASGSQSGS